MHISPEFTNHSNPCDIVQMTALEICIRQIDRALVSTQSTVVEDVTAALDTLEATFSKNRDKVLALESVIHTLARRRRALRATPVSLFIATIIDKRQDKFLREAA